MNAYFIRHQEPSDAAAVHEMLSDAATFGTMLGLPYPSLHERKERMLKQDGAAHRLVALSGGGELAGTAMLIPARRQRLLNTAELGIGVHRDWQGKGAGSALLAALLELADNWLGMRRIELTVFADNTRAQALCRKFGFAEEAHLRAYALRDGVYHDVLAMARLRDEQGGMR
jgi:putative acetyltransferase